MLCVQKLKIDDFEVFYKLKCENENIYWSNNMQRPQKEKYHRWFEEQLLRQDRIIFSIREENTNEFIGYFLLDFMDEKKEIIELTYAISNKFTNRGFGKELIKIAFKYCGQNFTNSKVMRGWVLEHNIRSQRCFLNNGWKMKDATKEIFFQPEDCVKVMNLFEADLN